MLPMNSQSIDLQMMQLALGLAEQSSFITSPNPRVGCVLVSPEGRILGMGRTQPAGGAHAEVMAIEDALQKGCSLEGATAYVTLEPCAHHGRTGPCCDALIRASVKQVVASCEDPNPLVSGQGFARLRAAGIEVQTGLLQKQAQELNIGFFHRMKTGNPWVRMKLAASLDGQTGLQNGSSQWITGEAARNDGHAWRARACAVLTGIGTVLQDNPMLNVRAVATTRQPGLVVVDSQLQTPLDAKLFAADRPVSIYSAVESPARQAMLEQRGAKVHQMANDNHKVDLQKMIRHLGQQQINELHLEAGYKLNGSLLRAGLVNELLVYLAPKMLGTGQGMAALGPFAELQQGLQLAFHQIEEIGPDLRILARFL